jgi:hypothetical protein
MRGFGVQGTTSSPPSTVRGPIVPADRRRSSVQRSPATDRPIRSSASGGMRERTNRHAWRACVGQLTVGSNPTPSAKQVSCDGSRCEGRSFSLEHASRIRPRPPAPRRAGACDRRSAGRAARRGPPSTHSPPNQGWLPTDPARDPRSVPGRPRSPSRESSSCMGPPGRAAVAGSPRPSTIRRRDDERSRGARTTRPLPERVRSRPGGGFAKRGQIAPRVVGVEWCLVVRGVARVDLDRALSCHQRFERGIQQRGVVESPPRCSGACKEILVNGGADTRSGHAINIA